MLMCFMSDFVLISFYTYLELSNFQPWELKLTFLINKKVVKSDSFFMVLVGFLDSWIKEDQGNVGREIGNYD